MSDKTPESEWTLPVVDSDSSAKTDVPDPGTTGAWATYAIGAVTKNLLKAEGNKKFPLIEEAEHPAQLRSIVSDNTQDE